MMAMESLEKVGGQKLLTILENNAEASNVPRIGVGNNTAHPATQANLAPAVAYVECNSMSILKGFIMHLLIYGSTYFRNWTAGYGRFWSRIWPP
jgi:hypothetical protein